MQKKYREILEIEEINYEKVKVEVINDFGKRSIKATIPTDPFFSLIFENVCFE